MKLERLPIGTASLFLFFLLSACETAVQPDLRSPSPSGVTSSAESAAVAGPIASLIGGTWSGTVHYTVLNGNTFDTPMTADVRPAQRCVHLTVGTSVTETVSAYRAGNGVSFSSNGPTSITEITLQPTANGSARVKARVTRAGLILATGAGDLLKN